MKGIICDYYRWNKESVEDVTYCYYRCCHRCYLGLLQVGKQLKVFCMILQVGEGRCRRCYL